MAQYPFLSPEWNEEARKIQSEFAGQGAPPAQSMRMNLVVTDVPFGDGAIQAHLDTTAGDLTLGEGHLETSDLKVTLDYTTAKAILVDGNPQAGMQAFMAGKIKVEGDMAKLLALQSAPADPVAAQVAGRMREITLD
ncbi:MAG TPA: SCP2 sterol-binding domain-containing protein [Acidimicrobiales bacterium]|nr:SCP2 sterol-binding domain-containing protein [Acidimicrobiales bacterium]